MSVYFKSVFRNDYDGWCVERHTGEVVDVYQQKQHADLEVLLLNDYWNKQYGEDSREKARLTIWHQFRALTLKRGIFL